MSTVKKRPQLSLEELHQLKWLLGTALAVLSAWTLFFLEVDAWVHLGLITLAGIAAVARPAWPALIPAWAHRLAFPLFVALFAYDLYVNREPLPALIRLDLLLLLYRVVTHRKRRDDLQVIVLGLFLVILAGVITVSLGFAVQILAFTACALAFLLLVTLTGSVEVGLATTDPAPGTAPHWTHVHWATLFRRMRAVSDWRILLLGGALFSGIVIVSGLLFLAIPRFELNNSLFIDRLINRSTRTGFSDSIRFGEVTDIQQDTSVALTVDVSDRDQLPPTPYWRMIVLDEYDQYGFRMSSPFRGQLLRSNRPVPVVRGVMYFPRNPSNANWTFYLEPGVSRFLPLLGNFTDLTFTEAQTVGIARPLRVVALRNDPPKMLAYRVRGLEVAAALPDRDFASPRNASTEPELPDFTELALSPSDLARLQAIVAEITGGASRDAADFARRAAAWLARHHRYSLTSTLPPGEADPLVRWLDSETPGHCEYFAGSFVLLARAVGLPARLVVGFKGGTWNGYSNSFTVRNSHAHAWAEVFDGRSSAWQRVDPTPAVTSVSTGASDADETALQRLIDNSWNARIESLRVFWYRRIVSFDRSSQVRLAHTAREAIESTGKRLRERLEAWAQGAKSWLSRPWDTRRWLGITGGAVVGFVALLAWQRLGRGWWLRWRSRHAHRTGDDPVRREAGRWLRKIADAEAPSLGATELSAVQRDLQRLRYGPRATWPNPQAVFRRARHTVRALRSR